MPLLVMANMQQKLEKVVQLKLFAFMAKLQTDDTLPGLHIEPIVNSADARARTQVGQARLGAVCGYPAPVG